MLSAKKILIFFLALATWLQMWAISTPQFGISISSITILLIAFINLPHLKLNYRYLVYSIVIILWMIISSWLLNDLSNAWVLRAVRYSMIMWIIILSNSLFRNLLLLKYFHKYITIIIILGCFYGLYQTIAPSYGLPYFLNVFNNNSSYSPKGLYFYYEGWVNVSRIYGAFSEPSYYAGFLAMFMVSVLFTESSGLRKALMFCLIGSNIILSYSRVGYAVVGIIVLLFFIFSKSWGRKLKYIIIIIVLATPFLMPLLMEYLLNNAIFTDISSIKRTMSQKYFFSKSLEIGNLLGHGISSISQDMVTTMDMDNYAHNGIITMLYEMGILSIVLYLTAMLGILKGTKYSTYNVILMSGFVILLCFGDFYSIESFVIMFVYLYNLPHYLSSIKKGVV